ncbi:MAG: UDP-3-O-acyl-N-acetylglucosamine deacetylase [Thermoguttaceae bacterium]
MEARRNQRTLSATAAIEGIGYWSGRDVRVEFRPAGPQQGIVFVRSDLPGCPRIPAVVANRIEMPRRTVLRSGGASVEMVEHIMAALAGMHVDNCEVWVDQQEMPGCDGSAQAFVAAIQQAGIVEQEAPREVFVVRQVLRLGNEECWIEARPATGGKTVIQYELDYGGGSPIGRQSLEVTLSPRYFQLSLASSRTFMLQREAAALQEQGLGQRITFSDLLVFDADGLIGNALRFPDECVRHKILDMVGDFALAGCDLAGRFAAYRSGHRLNAELVRAMLQTSRAMQETPPAMLQTSPAMPETSPAMSESSSALKRCA